MNVTVKEDEVSDSAKSYDVGTDGQTSGLKLYVRCRFRLDKIGTVLVCQAETIETCMV